MYLWYIYKCIYIYIYWSTICTSWKFFWFVACDDVGKSFGNWSQEKKLRVPQKKLNTKTVNEVNRVVEKFAHWYKMFFFVLKNQNDFLKWEYFMKFIVLSLEIYWCLIILNKMFCLFDVYIYGSGTFRRWTFRRRDYRAAEFFF